LVEGDFALWARGARHPKGGVNMKKAFKALLLAGLGIWSALSMAAVDVNSANAADLDSVKGIGPGTSSRIMEARKTGPFKDWTDFVDRVRGIGPGNAAKLSDNGLTVNGQTFKGAALAAPKAADKTPTVSAKAVEPPKKP
jgi:competence protein ComEA